MATRHTQHPGEGARTEEPQQWGESAAQATCVVSDAAGLVAAGSGENSSGGCKCGCQWCCSTPAASVQLQIAATWPGCASVPAATGGSGVQESGIGPDFMFVLVPLAAVHAACGSCASNGAAAPDLPPARVATLRAAQHGPPAVMPPVPGVGSLGPACRMRPTAARAEASLTTSGDPVRTYTDTDVKGGPRSSITPGEYVNATVSLLHLSGQGAGKMPGEGSCSTAAACILALSRRSCQTQWALQPRDMAWAASNLSSKHRF